MDKRKVVNLINEFECILIDGKKRSIQNSKRNPNGLMRRVKQSESPIVFDAIYAKNHQNIIKDLMKELPNYKNLILKKPELNDYPWKVIDYIDLYFNHYMIMVEKLRKITNDASI